MNIGDTLPNFRVPAIMDGHITALDLSQLRGRWTVLSCIQTFGPVETIFLEGQLERFEAFKTTLVGLILNDHPFHSPWVYRFGRIRLPLLADPLRRLSRALHCSSYPAPVRLRNIAFGPRFTPSFSLDS